MMHILNTERSFTRPETHLYVTGLQTVRSALISYGPSLVTMLLFLSARVVLGDEAFFRYRVWNVFLVLLTIFVVVEWCRSQARVILDEGSLSVTVPLLGDVALDPNRFQEATIVGPDSSRWSPCVGVAFSLLGASIFLILEVYHFLSGAPVDPISILFAAVLLVSAFQARQQRDYKELEMGFGVHSDWRRHVWSRHKVTFRGREEVLQELKRQVETAVSGLASP